MRYCVIGAGAMGGLYGLSLAAKGHDVDFLDVDATHVAAINRDGFRLSGITGDITRRVRASTEPEDFASSAEIVLFHPHTHGTRGAAVSAKTVLKPEGWAVTLQNGIGNVEALVDVLGVDRVVGGISYHSAALGGSGHAVHTNAGQTYLGELAGGGSARVDALAYAMCEAGFKAEVVSDIMSVIWTKFAHNCGVNALCAVSGLRTGDMARTEAMAEFQGYILEEIMAVVAAKGIKLTRGDPVGFIKSHTYLKYNKPSMQQHMDAARCTEIDSLNGALVREANTLGVAVPYNHALTLMVKGREAAVQRIHGGEDRDFAALEDAAKRFIAHGSRN